MEHRRIILLLWYWYCTVSANWFLASLEQPSAYPSLEDLSGDTGVQREGKRSGHSLGRQQEDLREDRGPQRERERERERNR